VTIGDGGFYFPARQDLDTAVSKFDPSSVRDVIVYRGPYTSLYGPGFAFLDLATLDAPRYQCGFESHGRTAGRYQTNGERWDAVQSWSMGDRDWGMRITYNYLQGNDYAAGDGIQVAGSYLSNNVNLALGFDLSKDSSLELKILRVHQSGLEFPGFYFDIRQLDTEAYSLRYTLRDTPVADKLTLDLWYNTTVADGDTRNAIKQRFVQTLLAESFNNATGTTTFGPDDFRDQSTTHFSNRSLGYRGGLWWGGGKGMPSLVLGNDLTALGQNLVENINFTQFAGNDVNTGLPVDPVFGSTYQQTQTIPHTRLINPGLFAELSLPFSDALTVRAGGRLDLVRTESGSRLIHGDVNLFGPIPQTPPPVDPFTVDPVAYSTNPLDPSLDRTFALYSGFASTDWKLDEHVVFSAGYAHAMRAPTLTELYAAGPFLGVLQQGTSRLIGDPRLKPEILDQVDLGVRTNYDWFRGSITAYYAFIQNYITYDQTKGSDNPDEVVLNQLVYTNTNLATLAGFESYGQVEATGWLSLFGGMSYVQGTDRSHRDHRRPADIDSSRRYAPLDGKLATATEALPQIPPYEFRTGFRVHEWLNDPNQAARWSVEFSVRHAASQHNIAESLGERETPSFTIFDLRSYWQVNDHLLLTAGIENIGDKLFREHLDPIAGNVLGVDPFYRPGRNFYIGTQLTY